MSNWDDLEAREAYLIRVGFSDSYISSKGREWVLMMTTQS